MAEAWDGQHATSCDSWDNVPYEPWKNKFNNEESDNRHSESSLKVRDDREKLDTAYEWMRNDQKKTFSKGGYQPRDVVGKWNRRGGDVNNQRGQGRNWTNNHDDRSNRFKWNNTENGQSCSDHRNGKTEGNQRFSNGERNHYNKDVTSNNTRQDYQNGSFARRGRGNGKNESFHSRNDERNRFNRDGKPGETESAIRNGRYQSSPNERGSYTRGMGNESNQSFLRHGDQSDERSFQRNGGDFRGNGRPHYAKGGDRFNGRQKQDRGGLHQNGPSRNNRNEFRDFSPPSRKEKDKQQEVKKRPMSYSRLKALLPENKDELLLVATNSRSGFQQLLNEKSLEPDVMAMVLEVLLRASESDQKRSVVALLNSVNSNKTFVILMMRYVLDLPTDLCNEYHVDALSHLVWYLLGLQKLLPAVGNGTVSMLLPIVRETVNKLISMEKLEDYSLLDVVDQLEEENTRIISSSSGQDRKRQELEGECHAIDPPDNFRAISVFPTKDDLEIDVEPFLRPILSTGCYVDTEHYLDVQFRLLREDFVRPLREGITKYQEHCKEKGKSKKVFELQVYQNVHVVLPRCTPTGILHNVSFDVKPFRNINWEASKKLLPGSLVCLSSDNFKTMLFAEVASRDPFLLKEGILDIRFDSLSESIMRLRPSETFVMLETAAYFEAYRHNLTKLQMLKESLLPMTRYIIEVKKDIRTPKYLSDSPRAKYDLRPIMMPFPDKDIAKISMDGEEFYPYNFPAPLGNGKEVEVVKCSNWPPPHELLLDENQYRALQTALTKEFAIIQGPPGTGKTFIGLRVIQTLLHNRHVWRKNDSPILIVCYTNHALDQFLEGILTFTTSMVRVGSKVENEELGPYKLRNLREERRSRRLMPTSLYNSIRDSYHNLTSLRTQVNRIEKAMTNASHVVLTERDLEEHMEEHLLENLRNPEMLPWKQNSLVDDGKLILDWLELRMKGHIVPKWLQDEPLVENKNDEVQNEAVKEETIQAENDEVEDVELLKYYDEEEGEWKDIGGENAAGENSSEDDEDDDNAEWEILGESSKRKMYIENQLKKKEVMTPQEIENVTDMWDLPLESRWHLYRSWVGRYAVAKLELIVSRLKEFQEELLRLKELRHMEDLNILRSASVVGMTTTGAAKYESLVRHLHPKIVVVEEAAEVLEAHIVTSLSNETEHLILIGDHQQLRPNPTVHDLGEKYNLCLSLFERMVKNGIPYQQLITQHRMRPSICRLLVPHIYPNLRNDKSVKRFGEIVGVKNKVFFVNHAVPEALERDGMSLVNTHEAKYLIALCKYLILQEYKPTQITILAAYSRQIYLIKKLVDKNPLFEGVHISSVDNYQGNENDIVLISFVRSNEEGYIGFLKVSNRVCVALSRAKKGLYCIGNFQLLAEKSDLWKRVVDILQERGQIGQALELVCQNHPSVCAAVSTADDFIQVPEGGCHQPCQERLQSCGHTCPRVCHPYDKEHKSFRCMEKCNKITCSRDHRCQRKCYQCKEKKSCLKCVFPVAQELPCGHVMQVPCSSNIDVYVCPVRCTRILDCGHKCTKTCGEVCTMLCLETVKSVSPCGHGVQIPCHLRSTEKELVDRCTASCNRELACGHTCKGTCGTCFQGRFHKRCQEPCSRVLVCGHTCKAFCAASCPPCEEDCENRCAHNQCAEKCGVPCKECHMDCVLRCPHMKCGNPCWEACNVKPCNRPCPETLKCQHQCVGLCGDPCPTLCRKCNRKELTEEFFGTGTETEEGARFVQLQDCGHVFEVEAFMQYLKTFEKGEIRLPCCPKCRKIIWLNQRFAQTIKICQARLEKVKEKVFGMRKELRLRQKKLKEVCEGMMTNTVHSVRLPLHKMSAILSKRDKLNIGMIATLENVLHFLQILSNRSLEFEAMKLLLNTMRLNSRVAAEAARFLQTDILHFVLEILKQEEQCSQQQLVDVSHELKRLNLFCTLMQELHQNKLPLESLQSEMQSSFRVAFEVLTNSLYMSDEDVSVKVRPAIRALTKIRKGAILGVTSSEKVQIVNAVGLSQGHWYQCDNGHVYCIGSCGGAMEESRCPECNVKIGGLDHQLVPGNRVATDMDGAKYSAWSEQANLANYQPIFDE